MGEQQSPTARRGTPSPRAPRDGAAARPQLVIVLAVVTVLILGFLVVRSVGSSGGPTRLEEADAYLAAWEESDFPAMAAGVADPPPEFTALHQQMLSGLGVREAVYEPGGAQIDGDRATVPYRASLTLGGLGVWRYENTLNLLKRDGEWLVDWNPATLYPGMQQGQRFARTRLAQGSHPRTGRTGRQGVRLSV